MTSNIPVAHVSVTVSVLDVMLSHALTTEREEILGLLLGNFVDPVSASQSNLSSSSSSIDRKEAEISSSVVECCAIHLLRRKDKRPDRVEVSSSDLSEAAQYAESKGLRVVGWYHSHPHITLHPSHVDLATQRLYQYLDPRFVGLIVSCFDKSKKGLGLLAFQTSTPKNPFNHDESPSNFEMESMDPYNSNIGGTSSQHDKSSSSFIEVNIPIKIVHGGVLSRQSNALEKLVHLVEILGQEEKEAYLDAIGKLRNNQVNLLIDIPTTETQSHPLLMIHSSAVYEKSLCRLLEYVLAPILTMLHERKASNQKKIEMLQAQKAQLIAKLDNMKATQQQINL